MRTQRPLLRPLLLVLLFSCAAFALAASPAVAATVALDKPGYVVGETVIVSIATDGLSVPELRVIGPDGSFKFGGALDTQIRFSPRVPGAYTVVLSDRANADVRAEAHFALIASDVASAPPPAPANVTPQEPVPNASAPVEPAASPNASSGLPVASSSQVSVPKPRFLLGEPVPIVLSGDVAWLSLVITTPSATLRYQGSLAEPVIYRPDAVGTYTVSLKSGSGDTRSLTTFEVFDPNGATNVTPNASVVTPAPADEPPVPDAADAVSEVATDDSTSGVESGLPFVAPSTPIGDTPPRFYLRDTRGGQRRATMRVLPESGMLGFAKRLFGVSAETDAMPIESAQDLSLPDGVDVELIPESGIVRSVVVQGLVGGTLDLGVDDVALLPSTTPDDGIVTDAGVSHRAWTSMFAMDPTRTNATSIIVSLTAMGDALYKCKEWNFTTQTCFGSWSLLRNLTPGENYTIEVGPADPGFGETIPVPRGGWTKTFGGDVVTIMICSDANCAQTATSFQQGDTVVVWANSTGNQVYTSQGNQIDVYQGADPSALMNTYPYALCLAGGSPYYHCRVNFTIPADWTDGWYYLDSDLHRTGGGGNYLVWRTPITVGQSITDDDALEFFADANRTRPADKFGPGMQVFVTWNAGVGYNANSTTSRVNIKTFHFNPQAGTGINQLIGSALTWTNRTGPFKFNFTMPAALSAGAGGWYWLEPNVSNATNALPDGQLVFGRMLQYQANTVPAITGAAVNSPNTSPVSVGQDLIWNVNFTDTDEIDRHALYVCSNNTFNLSTYTCWATTICSNASWTLGSNISCTSVASPTYAGNRTNYLFLCDPWGCAPSRQTNYTVFNDVAKPNVTLWTPANDVLGETPLTDFLVEFNYQPTDNFGFRNCTLYGNFSGAWSAYSANTTILNNTNNYLWYRVPGDGVYLWNVRCYDYAGNNATAPLNYTFTMQGPPIVTLLAPANDMHKPESLVNFTFNVTYHSTIDQCALLIDDVEVTTVNGIVTGALSSVEYDLVTDGVYAWNVRCDATDGNQGFGDGVYNVNVPHSLTIDTSPPLVNLLFPSDAMTYNDSTVTFVYNASDAGGLANCTLFIDGSVAESRSGIVNGENQSIPYIIDNGYHLWSVSCTDLAGLNTTSSTRYLTVNATVSSSYIFYETNKNATNYTSTAQVSLLTLIDSVENTVFYAPAGKGATYTYANAISPAFNSNGILIPASSLVNFSAIFTAQTANVGYLSWWFSLYNGSETTDICNSGNDATAATLITATAKTRYFSNCTTPAAPIRLYGDESVKLLVKVYNNDNRRRQYTHYIDNRSSYVAFNFTRLGFLAVNLTAPAINVNVSTGDVFNITCAVNCSGGTCFGTQVTLQRNTGGANWAALNRTTSSVVLTSAEPNPHNLSDVRYPGNYTRFLVNASALGTTTLRCWGTSNYSNATLTNSVNVTVQAIGVPTVQLLSPANNSFSNAASLLLLYIASSSKQLQNCSLFINGVRNQTNSSVLKDTVSAFNYTLPGEGIYNWSVNCTDTQGRSGVSLTYRFTVDRGAPQVVLGTPLNNSNLTSANITFNWTATDTVDPSLSCNITVDNAVVATNIPSTSGAQTLSSVAGFSLGLHRWNVTCADDAGNRNTSGRYQFNITNLAPSVALIAPANNTWTRDVDVVFYYNVTEPDDPLFNVSANYTATAVYRATSLSGANFPKYRTWSGTAWSAEAEMSTSGAAVQWVKVASSTVRERPREKVAVTLNANGVLTAYVWDGAAWTSTINFGTVDGATGAYRAFDVAYERASGRAIVVYSYNSANTAQDFAYRIWDGSSWSAATVVDDTFSGANSVIQWLALASDPDGAANNVAMAFIDAMSNDARALIWNGSQWDDERNISLALGLDTTEGVAIGYEQLSGDILAVAGQGSLVAYSYYNGSNWSVNGTFDSNSGSGSDMNWFTLKPNPANDELMLVSVDGAGSADLTTARWTGTTWASVTIQDAAVDTGAFRPADFAWEQTGSKGILSWGTTAGQLSYRPFAANTWGVAVSNPLGTNTHPWVTLETNPTLRTGDMKALGAVAQATTFTLGSLAWTGTVMLMSTNQLSAAQGTATYQAFDLAYDKLPPYAATNPPYRLANCSLFIDGAFAQANASTAWRELTNNFTVAGIAEGAHSWYVNCTDSDGSSGISPTRLLNVDRTAPWINLTAPANNSNHSVFTLNFSFTPIDMLSSWVLCSLTLDNVVNLSGINASNRTNTTRQISGMSDSVHRWNVTCVDIAGNSNTSLTYNFSTFAPPIVTLLSPLNNRFVSATNLTLFYNVTENSVIRNCSLYFDGVFNRTNQTPVIDEGLNNFTLPNVAETNHSWQVVCFDGGNLSGMSAIYNVTVDRTLPWTVLTYPPDNTVIRASSVTFNWTAFDNFDPLLSCNVTRKRPEGGYQVSTNIASQNGNATTVTQSGLLDGVHYWNVTCTDDAGNWNLSATYTFNVSKLPSVALQSPGNGFAGRGPNITLTYLPYQAGGLANCTLVLNGQPNQTNSTIGNNVNNFFTLTNAADGRYNWSVNCTDTTNGYENSTTWSFTLDGTPPAITLLAPDDTATVNNNTVRFNYTPFDQYSPTLVCNLTVNGTNYGTVNANVPNASVQNVTAVLHGNNASYIWNVTCRDQAGNPNTSQLYSFFVVAPPNVSLVTPAPNAVMTMNGTFVYRPYDPFGLQNCSLLIDGAVANSSSSIVNNTNNNLSAYGIPPGTHNWTVGCYDADGEYFAAPVRTFSSDAISPNVTLNAPPTGSNFTGSSILFNWTAYDDLTSNLSCTVYVDSVNVTGQVDSPNATPTTALVGGFTDGVHGWNVSCLDQGLNLNWSETRTFNMSQVPTVTLLSPPNKTSTNNATVQFQYVPSDNDGFANCSLYLNGTFITTNQSPVLNNQANNITLVLGSNRYNWSILCVDSGPYALANSSAQYILTLNLFPPTVLLNAPSPAYFSSVSYLLFNWTANETFGGNLTCNLTVNLTVKALNVNSPSATPVPRNISGFVDGQQFWNVTCLDPAGNNVTSELRNFTVQEPPAVSLGATPANNLRTTAQTLTFAFTATDNSGNLSGCTLILDGVANATNATPVLSGVATNITASSLTEGFHNWTISCSDRWGNSAMSPSLNNFTIDLTSPFITLLFPSEGYLFNTNNVTVNWTATDPYATQLTCNASVTNNGTLLFSPNYTQAAGSTFTTLFSNLTEGEHNWSVTCRDDLFNANMSLNRTFLINQPDLSVNGTKLSFNRTNPFLGEQIAIRANVTNLGGTPAVNALVEFWDGAPNVGLLIGSMAATVGVNATVVFSVPWNVTAGYHTIWVVVDPADAIAELDEQNNNASLNLSAIVVNITSPANGTLLANATPRLDFNATDFTTGNLSYKIYVNGIANGQNGSAVSGANTSLILSALPDGYRTIVVEATDALGRARNATGVTLLIDTAAPNSTILTVNGTYFNTVPMIAVNITDRIDAILNYTLYVDGAPVASGNTNNASLTLIQLDGLVNGTYTLVLQVWDDAQNAANSSPITIVVDTVAPSVTPVSPSDAANFTSRNVTLVSNVTDNLDSLLGCNLTLDGVVVQQANVTNASLQQYNASGLSEGVHQWNVTCWDGNNAANQVNNVATGATRTFSVSIPPNITLLSPANNTISRFSTQAFVFNVSDETGLANCSLYLNGVLNATKTGAQLAINATNNFTVAGLNNTVLWSILCVDNSTAFSTAMSPTRNLTVDLLSPGILLLTQDGTWFNLNNPTIRFNATDNYATTMNTTLYVDGVANVTSTATNGAITATPLVGIIDGMHTVVVQATDTAGNVANATAITIWVDTRAPNVTLLLPANDTHLFDTQTSLNFTVTDNLAETLVCNLTLDSIRIGTNLTLTNGSTSTTPVSGLSGGYHSWYASCADNATNIGTSQTWLFYIELPDLVINLGNITFSNSTPIENQTVQVNATVYNIGLIASANFTVQFWRGDPQSGGVQLGANLPVTPLAVNGSVTLSLNYSAVIGINQLYVVVDPPAGSNGSIRESNETNNIAHNDFTVGLYDVFAGGSANDLRVANSLFISVFNWNQDDVTGSNVFVADSSSNLHFGNLQALGRNASGAPSPGDFATLDTKLGTASLNDSINRTWTSANAPIGVTSIASFKQQIDNIPIVNSTNTDSFVTGILWDRGDGGNAYTGAQDVAFMTVMNQAQVGQYGTYDYEIKVPAPMRDYVPGGGSVTFYVELR